MTEVKKLAPYLKPEQIEELVKIQKQLRAIRKARRLQVPAAFRRLNTEGRKTMERAAQSWQKMIKSNLLTKLKGGLHGGTPAQIADNLADWDELEKEGQKLLGPALYKLYRMGARSLKFKGGGALDPITGRAVQWAKKYGATLVKQITTESREAIRIYTARAIRDGRTLPHLARELRYVVGLNEKQGESLSKYYGDLAESGLSEEEMDSLSMKEAGAKLRDRAEMIARTETAKALSEGVLGAYGEHGISSVEWVADPSACEEICLPHHGEVFTIEEASGQIPAHPRCECCWVMAMVEGGAEEEATIE